MGLVKFIADRFHQLRRPLAGSEHHDAWRSREYIGRLGERMAARHLKKVGMTILYRNFRAPHGGEVDIVARDGQVLAFVEVKTRTSEKFGRPVDAVGMDKRFLICRGAFEWLRLLDDKHGEINYRFDVVEVCLNMERNKNKKINLIKGAFESPDSYLTG